MNQKDMTELPRHFQDEIAKHPPTSVLAMSGRTWHEVVFVWQDTKWHSDEEMSVEVIDGKFVRTPPHTVNKFKSIKRVLALQYLED